MPNAHIFTREQKQSLTGLIEALDPMGVYLVRLSDNPSLSNDLREQFDSAAVGMAQVVASLERVQRLINGLPAYAEKTNG